MSYLALYRKYRSKTFDEVVGQEHVTNTLKNQIATGKFAHAYLLCGIRGVGKTSIARILAKAVNCEHPVDGNPCLECEMCKEIEASANLNVIEIDAASNTGVDNIKEIRDDAAYMPSKGQYKVYIVDEVHMLSTNAFNALLKILEEPPKHVIFIFATTESQKIPATILSRCQRFDLKRISRDAMIERLQEYLTNENLSVELDAIKYIVSLSEGSMRDALSILEQVISIKKEQTITLDDILEALGNVDYHTFSDLTQALISNDSSHSIELINKVYEDGKEIRNFLVQYMNYLRNLLLIINSNSAVNILDMSKENIEEIKNLSQNVSSTKVIKFIETLSKVEVDTRYSNTPKLLLEIALIKLCNVQTENLNLVNEQIPIKKAMPKQEIKEIKVETSIVKEETKQEQSQEIKLEQKQEIKEEKKIEEIEKIEVNENKKQDVKEESFTGDYNDVWNKVVVSFDPMTRALLGNSIVTKVDSINFYVRCDNDTAKILLEKKKDEIAGKLDKNGIKDKQVIFYVDSDIKKEEVNNTPKNADNNIDELAGDLANLGINVNIE